MKVRLVTFIPWYGQKASRGKRRQNEKKQAHKRSRWRKAPTRSSLGRCSFSRQKGSGPPLFVESFLLTKKKLSFGSSSGSSSAFWAFSIVSSFIRAFFFFEVSLWPYLRATLSSIGFFVREYSLKASLIVYSDPSFVISTKVERGSQVASEIGNPIHFVRYFQPDRNFISRILSTIILCSFGGSRIWDDDVAISIEFLSSEFPHSAPPSPILLRLFKRNWPNFSLDPIP